MSNEEKGKVSSGSAFLIGVLMGAGVMLVYHAYQVRGWRDELKMINRMAEEYRQSAFVNKSERMRLQNELEKSAAPAGEKKD